VQNIEVKTPLHDWAKAETRLEALGAKRTWTRKQVDTFFKVPLEAGWLKLREAEGRPPELIAYERTTSDSGPRPSDYEVAVVKDAELMKRLLARVLPVEGVVRKERTLWIYEHTRIHLDQVDGLGDFIELETVVDDIPLSEAREEADRLVHVLALDPQEFVAVPYMRLLETNR
jgi:predicted adenylyl cyclase CyaB